MPFEAETVNGAHCDITAWVGDITGTLAAESVPPRPSSDASDLQDLTRTYSQDDMCTFVKTVRSVQSHQE
ncbi:unnamed protein product [Arctogadus glacialis]